MLHFFILSQWCAYQHGELPRHKKATLNESGFKKSVELTQITLQEQPRGLS